MTTGKRLLEVAHAHFVENARENAASLCEARQCNRLAESHMKAPSSAPSGNREERSQHLPWSANRFFQQRRGSLPRIVSQRSIHHG